MQEQARREKEDGRESPRRSRVGSFVQQTGTIPYPVALVPQQPVAGPSQPYGFSAPQIDPNLVYPAISLSDGPARSPHIFDNRYHPYLPRQATPSPSIVSSHDADLGPSDSISQVASGSSNASSRPASRAASRQVHRRSSFAPPQIHVSAAPWSQEEKRRYEKRLARITASCGFPLAWVENPEWLAFLDDYIPNAHYVSRKVLTQRVLRDVANEFREQVKQECRGREATLQADGWTGINNHHLVAFMITCDKKVSDGMRITLSELYLSAHCIGSHG